MSSKKPIQSAMVVSLVFLSACERVAQPHDAVVDRSSTAPTLAISINRADVAYMADHDIRPMIGTGPCGREGASVWYLTDVISANGHTWDNPADAIRNDIGERFTLSATMEYPTPAATDNCAYLTSVGYSLHSLMAQSVPLRVASRPRL